MDSIKKLNKRIKGELHLREFSEDDLDQDELELEDGEFTDDELEDQEDEASIRDSKTRIRLENETRIRGLIRNVEFDINFRDLADRINDSETGISGVVLTRDKAHQLFNIVRELMGF